MAVRGAGAAVVASVVIARTHQLCNNQRCGYGMGVALDFRFLAGTCCRGLSAQLLSLRADVMVPTSLLDFRTGQCDIDIGMQFPPAF